jgi:membrane protein DedA with SNARE-associated domain
MPRSAARLITAVVVAATGVCLGVSLAIYSEKDDAPGGVLIAMILMLGSVALGIWIARRGARTAAESVKG